MNERVRAYQVAFRDVNHQIAQISSVQGETESSFLCECGEEDCDSTIRLGLAEYAEVRRGPEFFIASPGHRAEGVDRLVEVRQGFDVIVPE